MENPTKINPAGRARYMRLRRVNLPGIQPREWRPMHLHTSIRQARRVARGLARAYYVIVVLELLDTSADSSGGPDRWERLELFYPNEMERLAMEAPLR